jgi:anti-anti-sigma factor
MSQAATTELRDRVPTVRPLALTVQDSESILVIRMAGDFDLAGVGQVMVALDRLDARYTTHLIFDLRELNSLDLAGLRIILRANDYCKRRLIPVTVIKPRGVASRVFTLTRVHLELDLVESLASENGEMR